MKGNKFATMICILFVGAFAMLFAASLVMALPGAPSSPLTPISSSSRDLSGLPAQSIAAQGGNVTEINIAALTITKSWQGYYGNITGQIALQDATNSTFYNWSLASFNGRVFATRNSTVVWTTVNCTNSTARAAEETYLGQVAGDGDSVTNTFATGTHPLFVVGTTNITANSCYTTRGYVSNNTQANNFVMVLLQSANNIIYTSLTNKSTTGFDGKLHDFELLVGENEKAGSIGVTTYYFWTEFN